MISPHEWIASTSAWLWPRVVDHLWQATLFGLVVLALSFALKRGPARTRHFLWLIASAKFVIPAAFIVFISEAIGIDVLWRSLTGTNSDANPLLLGLAEPASAFANSYEIVVSADAVGHNEIYCALTAIWLAGLATLVLSRLLRRAKVRHALNFGKTVTVGREWLALQRARKALRFKGDVHLVISSMQMEPGVCRVRKPVILLPESIAEHLDDAELETIMLHELIHVERRDNLTGKLQLALTAVFWFHPLVWFISRRLFDEREQACDEKVLEICGTPETYASSILKVVRFSFGWKAAGVTGAGSGSNLRRRIENIMTGNKERRTGLMTRLLMGTVMGITLVGLVVAAGHSRARPVDAAVQGVNVSNAAGDFEPSQPTSAVDADKRRQLPRAQEPPPPPPPSAQDVQPPSPPSPSNPASPAQPRNSDQPAPPAQPPTPPTPQEKPAKSREEKKDMQKGGLIEAPRPVYPEEAKKQKVEGTVSVEIVIGEDGNVVSTGTASGPELLQGAARDAAMKARFKPTLVSGKPAKVSGTMSYKFVLDEKEKTQ